MKDVHIFHAMTDEQHIATGHIKESAGAWIDPKDYIDTYYADW